LFPLFATGVIDTSGKFAFGVVETGGKLLVVAAGIVDTGGKFATGNNNTSVTGSKVCLWCR
jgi:hypothetical protein